MPSIEDFVVVRSLSSGAFGKVVLAKHRVKQDQLYAVKVMEKQHMLNKNMAARINKEKNALAVTHSDLVVKIFYALESRSKIYLVMEYMVGGDLKTLLKRFTVFSQQVARFYVAECALALEYLHKHGIIHRDIKPDNILLGADGHIKLTDFGLCNFKQDKIGVADIIATPLNPARKLPARTPGQVLSLITNFRLTPRVDATYASSPSFVTAYDSSSAGNLSTIGEEFSTPQNGCSGESDRFESCFTDTQMNHENETSDHGATPLFRGLSSSGYKRSFRDSFGSENSIDFLKKRHRSDRSAKRLWFTVPGESGASSTNTTFEYSLVYRASNIGILPQRATTMLSANVSPHSPLMSCPQSSDTSAEFSVSLLRASTPHDEEPNERQPHGSVCGIDPTRRSLNATTSSFGSQNVTPISGRSEHRGVRFMSLVQTHTTIEEHSDRQPSSRVNASPEPSQRLTKSVTDVTSSLKRQLKKKQNAMSQSGILGTPDYLAPEILREEPHTPAVDIWSLGVCLYEFLVGCPPFTDETVEKVFTNILNRAIEYPEADEALSSDAVDTIERLLDPHVIRRPSAVTLRSLPLFQDVDFVQIHDQQPPWIPESEENAENQSQDIGGVLSSY